MRVVFIFLILLQYKHMGFFSSNKPKRVTKLEMKKIKSRLYSKLDKKELAEVEKLFRADLLETGIHAGIDQSEFDNSIKWLKENKNKHVLEDDDIALVEEYFTEHLKD